MRKKGIFKKIVSKIFDTSARFSSSVRRINERLRRLADKLGTESKVYQDAAANLDSLIDDSHLYYNKNGILQIGKPSTLYKDVSSHKAIKNLDDGIIPTWGKIKEQYDKEYNEYLQGQANFEDITINLPDFINIQTSVSDLIYDFSKDRGNERLTEKEERALEILQKKGNEEKGRISYYDLSRVYNLLKDRRL